MAYIRLKNVCVDYPIYNTEARSLKKHFIRLTTGGTVYRENSKCIVRGLDDLTLNIEFGDRIGLIGHNGAGKSTLLRTLAGIYQPTEGTIETKGNISSLFNVMLGFDHEATGEENIFIRGVLMGISKKEMKGLAQEISDFTELGDYLKMPIRTYSAGMVVRLAFAIATSVHPEILLIDEVVGVGDSNFIKKARRRVDSLIDRSSIVVLAIHDFDMLKKLCNKIIWLDAGKLKFMGDVQEGIDFYLQNSTSAD